MDHDDDSTEPYEIFAIKYGASAPGRFHFQDILFSRSGQSLDQPSSLNLFVWIVRNSKRTILIDSGANRRKCEERGWAFLRCPIEALSAIGVKPEDVDDVVLTHMHWDHTGNLELLPNARVHLQLAEWRSVTGPDMAIPAVGATYNVDDVVELTRRLYRGSLILHDGDATLFDGVEVMKVGGHSAGLQIIRVLTKRGWITLANDAAHSFHSLNNKNPYPYFHNIADTLRAFETLGRFRNDDHQIIPGHDPSLLTLFPSAGTALGPDIVRIDLPPLR